ncbi:adenylate kinase [Ascobolus immersus RN42]|uniref:Adenylate kinase n=1 Tax=Ascobolus immersus RN42 TaxID=1160509 RepID=A0A3N4HCK3_ASCIM|nr:adenylate kinase [Ascobolus immersus RN42]
MSTTRTLTRAARLILIGPPGCGKGTQTQRILNTFPQISALSAGDLLRENVRLRTPLGIRAESVLREGRLLPDDTVTSLIISELATRGWIAGPGGEALAAGVVLGDRKASVSDDPASSFLLDGFPRTRGQAEGLSASGVSINLAVQIDMPDRFILERFKDRMVHPASGRSYNLSWKNPPPKDADGNYLDEVTGEKLVKRDDDKEETVMRRLDTYKRNVEPLLEYYGRDGVLVTITGSESDKITPEIFRVMDRFA